MNRTALKRLCWFHAWLLWGALFVLLALKPDTLSLRWHFWLALVTWLLCLWHCTRHSQGGLFSPSVAYVLLLGVFHFGLVGTVLIGIKPAFPHAWVSSAHLPTALALCGMAFSFLASGNALATLRHRGESVTDNPSALWSSRDFANRRLFVAGLGLGLLGLCLLAVGAGRLGVFSVSYAESWRLRELRDPRLFGVGLTFALMGMVVSAVGADKRRILYVALLFALAFTPLVAYGFRGHFVVYFAALLLVWHRKDPRTAMRVAVVFALLIVVFAPTVMLTRSHQATSAAELIRQVPSHSLFAEMGGTMRILVETIGTIEQRDTSYWCGHSYAFAIGRVIPNVSWVWRPHPSRSEEAPSGWITSRIAPWTFRRGGGVGFSGIAEPYLNFGVPGVIFFFVLLGYALMQCDYVPRQNVYLTAVVMCAFGGLLWTTRNDFASFVRPAVWGACFVYLTRALPARNRIRREP